LEGQLNIDKVRHYFDHSGFITPIADDLANQISSMYEQGLTSGDISIIFDTHSIPTAMGVSSGPPARREEFAGLVGEGGTYAAQHLAAASETLKKVAEKIGSDLPAWSLVYQSRSGSPSVL
jgi:ferrochelatase